jgi:hypothetical protein
VIRADVIDRLQRESGVRDERIHATVVQGIAYLRGCAWLPSRVEAFNTAGWTYNFSARPAESPVRAT